MTERSSCGGGAVVEHEPGLTDLGMLNALHGPEPNSEVVQAVNLVWSQRGGIFAKGTPSLN